MVPSLLSTIGAATQFVSGPCPHHRSVEIQTVDGRLVSCPALAFVHTGQVPANPGAAYDCPHIHQVRRSSCPMPVIDELVSQPE